MIVVGKDKIVKFMKKHADSRSTLNKWLQTVETATWKNFSEVKNSYGSTDYRNGKLIFNIGGNKYRLIAIAIFKGSILQITHILTHKEYDKGKWDS